MDGIMLDGNLRRILYKCGWTPSGDLVLDEISPRQVRNLVNCLSRRGTITPELLKRVARDIRADDYAAALTDLRAARDCELIRDHLSGNPQAKAYNLALAGRRAPTDPRALVNVFKIEVDDLEISDAALTRFTHVYILPTDGLPKVWKGGLFEKVELDEVFDPDARGDALNLWTPGSGDVWASFAHCYKTATLL